MTTSMILALSLLASPAPAVDPFQAPATKEVCNCQKGRLDCTCAPEMCRCAGCATDPLIKCCDGKSYRLSEWRGVPLEYPPVRGLVPRGYGPGWTAGGYSSSTNCSGSR